MEILKAKQITKRYLRKKVFDGLDLNIEVGKIYGLLGPNGCGKTTLMKMMAGLIRPTSGQITVGGKQIGIETKSIVSFVPTVNHLPKWMKIKHCISYFADMFPDFDVVKAKEMLEFMELQEEQKTNTLSTGMLCRLKLTLALSRNAKLYILDEPLNGLDPISREKVMEVILGASREDSTIIISSHLIKELENILDEVIYIGYGKVLLKGNAEQLRLEKGMSMDELYREVYANA